MANFASFWAGRPLSKIEQTALSSFVYHGHSFILFVYNMNLEVPEGVVKMDANEIIPESRLFKVDKSYAPFADMFRYKMIKDTGLTWTDTDNICLQDKWKFPEYLFGMQGGPHKLVANGILRAPKDSKIINDLVNLSNSFDKDKIVWGEIGPQLVTEKIKEYKLGRYIQDPSVFYPVDYWNWKHIFDPEHRDEVLKLCRKSHTLQIWNQMVNRGRYNNNMFEEGSAMQYFYDKYVGK